MPLYEHVYLARQDLSAQQVEELTAKLSGVIGEAGGKIAKTEYWGLKSLTYRIRKNRKAHLTLHDHALLRNPAAPTTTDSSDTCH